MKIIGSNKKLIFFYLYIIYTSNYLQMTILINNKNICYYQTNDNNNIVSSLACYLLNKTYRQKKYICDEKITNTFKILLHVDNNINELWQYLRCIPDNSVPIDNPNTYFDYKISNDIDIDNLLEQYIIL